MPDPHGIDSWDPERFARIHVHIVNSEAFTDITGLAAPPTPVSAETYIDWGLPWSERWDSERDVAPRRATHEARAM